MTSYGDFLLLRAGQGISLFTSVLLACLWWQQPAPLKAITIDKEKIDVYIAETVDKEKIYAYMTQASSMLSALKKDLMAIHQQQPERMSRQKVDQVLQQVSEYQEGQINQRIYSEACAEILLKFPGLADDLAKKHGNADLFLMPLTIPELMKAMLQSRGVYFMTITSADKVKDVSESFKEKLQQLDAQSKNDHPSSLEAGEEL